MVNKETVLSWRALFLGLSVLYLQLLVISELFIACCFSSFYLEINLENTAVCACEGLVCLNTVPQIWGL